MIGLAKSAVTSILRQRGLKIAREIDTGSWLSREEHDRIAYNDYDTRVLKEKPFYNIGAGGFRHRYWTNIDMPSDWYARDQSDFTPYDIEKQEPLPLQGDCAQAVYTSHTIEHVSDC